MSRNATSFFTNLRNSIGSATGIPPATLSASVNPATSVAYAAYQVRINGSAGETGTLETAFNSAVQSGFVQAALQQALGSSALAVMPADPVQAQRLAVQVALSLASTPADPSLYDAALEAYCQRQATIAREWFGCGRRAWPRLEAWARDIR